MSGTHSIESCLPGGQSPEDEGPPPPEIWPSSHSPSPESAPKHGVASLQPQPSLPGWPPADSALQVDQSQPEQQCLYSESASQSPSPLDFYSIQLL